jgi:hypothetical protein
MTRTVSLDGRQAAFSEVADAFREAGCPDWAAFAFVDTSADFADDKGYEIHQVTKGKNPRTVKRRKLPGGRYDYREMDEEKADDPHRKTANDIVSALRESRQEYADDPHLHLHTGSSSEADSRINDMMRAIPDDQAKAIWDHVKKIDPYIHELAMRDSEHVPDVSDRINLWTNLSGVSRSSYRIAKGIDPDVGDTRRPGKINPILDAMVKDQVESKDRNRSQAANHAMLDWLQENGHGRLANQISQNWSHTDWMGKYRSMADDVSEHMKALAVHHDLARVRMTDVPVVSEDRGLGSVETAKRVRELFSRLGLKGMSVTSSGGGHTQIRIPQRQDAARYDVREQHWQQVADPANVSNQHDRDKVKAILAMAFPNHDNRSDSMRDRFDFKWIIS